MARRKIKTHTTSLAGVSAEERETAERIAGGNRYPDRAALRGKVRRMTRQREALERARRRAERWQIENEPDGEVYV